MYLDGMFANDGIVSSGDFAVSAQATPEMSVRIAPGQAWIRGTQIVNQGIYSVTSDGFIDVNIATSESFARLDLVVLRVYDSAISGSYDLGQIEVIKGLATTSPVLPDLPPNSIPLARVSVGAGTTSVSNSNIISLRNSALFKAEFGGSLWQQSSWVPMTPLAANVTNYENGFITPAYRKVGAYKVELRGVVKVSVTLVGYGTKAADIFQFPEGFIPAKVQLMPCMFGRTYAESPQVAGSATTGTHSHIVYWPSPTGRLSVTTTGRMYFQPGFAHYNGEYVSLEGNYFILN